MVSGLVRKALRLQAGAAVPRRLKEGVWFQEYESFEQARVSIGRYMDYYHNQPHSGLDYRVPNEVRAVVGSRQGVYEVRRHEVSALALVGCLATLALAIGPMQLWAIEQGNGPLRLVVSSSPDRSDASPLLGSTLSGNRYIFLKSEAGIENVRFYLDDPGTAGPPFRTESDGPYDVAGNGEHGASPLRTATLSNGRHTVTALVRLQSGKTDRIYATFAVFNYGRRVQTGVFIGGGPSAVTAFERWAGHPVPYIVDFEARWSWKDIANPPQIDKWRGTGQRVVYSVAMLPDNGKSSMAAGARGDNNRYFQQLAQNLVAKGQGKAIIRIGWEFNGDWFRWSAFNATEFKQYWRQIVGAMRSVPGQSFEFDWSVNAGDSQSGDPLLRYPGDDVVDYVGVDAYDQSWAPNTYPYPSGCDSTCRLIRQKNAWSDLYYGFRGLRFWAYFAASQGKPLSIPEWGLTRSSGGHGGGDNPYYIEKMHEFIHSANNVGYHAYFEYDEPHTRHRLMTGQFPKAAAVYRELFGGGRRPEKVVGRSGLGHSAGRSPRR